MQRETNDRSSLDEGAFRHSLVVINHGPTEAKDVEIRIVSAWNNALGTRARFADGDKQSVRVGRVLPSYPAILALSDDPAVDFGDIGECEVAFRDDSASTLQHVSLPARPNW